MSPRGVPCKQLVSARFLQAEESSGLSEYYRKRDNGEGRDGNNAGRRAFYRMRHGHHLCGLRCQTACGKRQESGRLQRSGQRYDRDTPRLGRRDENLIDGKEPPCVERRAVFLFDRNLNKSFSKQFFSSVAIGKEKIACFGLQGESMYDIINGNLKQLKFIIK